MVQEDGRSACSQGGRAGCSRLFPSSVANDGRLDQGAHEANGGVIVPSRNQGGPADAPQGHAAFIDEFRRNGGKVGGPLAGGSLLILQTTGAKSGRQRFTLLGYVAQGDRYYVLDGTAYYGATKKPDWYCNLLANPNVSIEVGSERFPATARPLAGEERRRIWPLFLASELAYLLRFAEETNRELAIVELTPTT
jgi:deazaflavin-dependent oxidoreductase (nitroreductase family)